MCKSTRRPALRTWNNGFPTEGRVPVVGLADLAGRHVRVIRGRSSDVPKLSGTISAMSSEKDRTIIREDAAVGLVMSIPSQRGSTIRGLPNPGQTVVVFGALRLLPVCGGSGRARLAGL